jgi:hypothetical protein
MHVSLLVFCMDYKSPFVSHLRTDTYISAATETGNPLFTGSLLAFANLWEDSLLLYWHSRVISLFVCLEVIYNLTGVILMCLSKRERLRAEVYARRVVFYLQDAVIWMRDLTPTSESLPF